LPVFMKKFKDLPRYFLSEIPNTEDGKAFINELKKYLNPRYKLTVRGQYQSEASKKAGESYPFGAPIKASKCLRVYIADSHRDENLINAAIRNSEHLRIRFKAIRQLEESLNTLRGVTNEQI
jgi:hypothetical protein